MHGQQNIKLIFLASDKVAGSYAVLFRMFCIQMFMPCLILCCQQNYVNKLVFLI
jgi:hypothetical protein